MLVNDRRSFREYERKLGEITDLTWRYDKSIPVLPPNLEKFTLDHIHIRHVHIPYSHNLPNNFSDLENLEDVYISGTTYRELPHLPPNLKKLYCSKNKLIILPILPQSLKKLSCQSNNISELPNLPEGIKKILCQNNKLISLPDLPRSLTYLDCSNNYIHNLPEPRQGLILISENQMEGLPLNFEDGEEIGIDPDDNIPIWFNPDIDILPDIDRGIMVIDNENNEIVPAEEVDEEDFFVEPEPDLRPRRVREEIEGLFGEERIVEYPRYPRGNEGIGLEYVERFEDDEGFGEGMPEREYFVGRINRRIQENIRRANERYAREEKKDEIKYDHKFDTSKYCHSPEDLFGTPFTEVEKIYIFIIDNKIFCFSMEELFPSLNSKNQEGLPFKYYSDGISNGMYKLPLFGFINEKVFNLIEQGKDTFKLRNPREVLLSFQNYVPVYTGDAIDRKEFINNLS